MTTNKKISLAVLCVLILGLAVVAYAYESHTRAVPTATIPATVPNMTVATEPMVPTAPTLNIPDARVTPVAKVAASGLSNGTYVVEIQSIMTDPEESTITFSHVTYFEGAEATASAKHDFPCGGNPESYCVHTLANGYYVRASGAPTFTVPVTTNTVITLTDKQHATVADLRNLVRQFPPVFDAVITDGNLTSLTEKAVPQKKS